jgi:hypothetical protein
LYAQRRRSSAVVLDVHKQEAAAARVEARVSPGSLRKPETILCFCLKIPKIVLYDIYNSSHLIIGKYSNNSNNAAKGRTWALGAPSGRGPLATSRPSSCIVHARHNSLFLLVTAQNRSRTSQCNVSKRRHS